MTPGIYQRQTFIYYHLLSVWLVIFSNNALLQCPFILSQWWYLILSTFKWKLCNMIHKTHLSQIFTRKLKHKNKKMTNRHAYMQTTETTCKSKLKVNKGCFLTLLTEVTGQAVVQIFVEICAMSLLQSCAQTEVRKLHMTLETEKHTMKNSEATAHKDAFNTISTNHLVTTKRGHCRREGKIKIPDQCGWCKSSYAKFMLVCIILLMQLNVIH